MSAIIDPTIIRDIRTGADDALLREVVDIFVTDVPFRVKELRIAIAREDKQQFINAANSIKGSALALGAVQLRRKAEIIERTGKNADITGLGTMLPVLERSFHEAATELKRMVA